MAKLFLLLIFGLIPTILTKCNVREGQPHLSKSINTFSAELLTKIAQGEENHFVVSTVSIWILLASISLGATDVTLKELDQVLKWKNKQCFNKNHLKFSTNNTSYNTTGVVMERSSNIYVDSKLTILNKFKNKILRYDVSKIENISFDNTDSAAQTINDYVRNATHNNIENIVSPGDLVNVLMIMFDVVYFKGTWQIPFLPEDTQISPFYNDDGDKIGDVNLMTMTSNLKMISIKDMNAYVLELPYGTNKKYSMLLFLPLYGKTLNSVIENLKNIRLPVIDKMLKGAEEDEVTVQIPRFEIKSDLRNLKTLLVGMGLKSAFDSSKANFKSISHQPLYISNLIQKATIKVTEEGTVASAATEADFSFRTAPDEFIANRPFLFMILDKKLLVPIFTGVYSKPSLF
ncbi:unnamed protein product [Euphydryas editha]|uniref:Serpin domain-containing protein n=1 Tax=Euphydryas editha TaxID=104508 RepID=A0AAU9UFZ2_EUPED|nr:unnamed protein product [Euphydryas editha]